MVLAVGAVVGCVVVVALGTVEGCVLSGFGSSGIVPVDPSKAPEKVQPVMTVSTTKRMMAAVKNTFGFFTIHFILSFSCFFVSCMAVAVSKSCPGAGTEETISSNVFP